MVSTELSALEHWDYVNMDIIIQITKYFMDGDIQILKNSHSDVDSQINFSFAIICPCISIMNVLAVSTL